MTLLALECDVDYSAVDFKNLFKIYFSQKQNADLTFDGFKEYLSVHVPNKIEDIVDVEPEELENMDIDNPQDQERVAYMKKLKEEEIEKLKVQIAGAANVAEKKKLQDSMDLVNNKINYDYKPKGTRFFIPHHYGTGIVRYNDEAIQQYTAKVSQEVLNLMIDTFKLPQKEEGNAGRPYGRLPKYNYLTQSLEYYVISCSN